MHHLRDLLAPYMHNTFSPLLSPSILPHSLPEPAPLPIHLPTRSCSLLSHIVTVEDALDSESNEEDPYSIVQRDWTEYDVTNPNHYPISYLDHWGRFQTCPYIHYIFDNGVPMIQGCMDPHEGVYREILHAHPSTTPGVPGEDDNFTSFHPYLAQCLLVDNALTRLEDIGIIAKVSHYCASVVEESIQHQNVAHAESTLCHAREKKISTEGHLFCAQ